MTAKTTNILYWICTILFAGLMIFTAVPNVMDTPESRQVIHDYLGYPLYFIPFIGVAKIIGSILILVPGLNKIKEWAYAGLFFDLFGAIYSTIAVAGKVDPMMLTLLVWVFAGVFSYILWSIRMKRIQTRTVLS